MRNGRIRRRAGTTIMLISLLSACSPAVEQAAASPPTPDFPDLSGYTPVDTQEYMQSYPYFRGFDLVTPDGQQCNHNAMNSLGDPSRMTLTCDGPRPDQGPGTWEVRVATDQAATIEQTEPLDPSYPADPSMRPKQLPAMHKITYQSIECGADATGMTACRVGDHGFVLTPTSTHLF
ncbi:hypothetical protein Mycch_4260 [Mycolicibacterium chubuense NBB4]|uniref:Lipoprotein LppI n=1 Tax=Mycolicibacterium chubuense (strain NBB4) TaxID=710421 RepID=I4BNW7_MYCCN|nr:hypothetical protein Mycch_4260 [Mycolicibacterium chubuense NBB4]